MWILDLKLFIFVAIGAHFSERIRRFYQGSEAKNK